MIERRTSVYRIGQAIPLRGAEYFQYLNGTLHKATKRIWVAMFIVNPTVHNDRGLDIRKLAKSLAYARWRNVDVRVLIGSSRAPGIAVANDTARSYLIHLQIPVHTFVAKYRRSLHSKYVLIDDDQVVVGSHNWTPGAANRQNEDSVALRSLDLGTKLADEFLSLWKRATEE